MTMIVGDKVRTKVVVDSSNGPLEKGTVGKLTVAGRATNADGLPLLKGHPARKCVIDCPQGWAHVDIDDVELAPDEPQPELPLADEAKGEAGAEG